MKGWCEFVNEVARIEFLRDAKEDAIKDWGEDIPTTVLFSQFGKTIVKKFYDFSLEDRARVFRIIEDGMISEDAELVAFVATGLLEALAAGISKDPALEGRVNLLLGDSSKNYLRGLADWYQK